MTGTFGTNSSLIRKKESGDGNNNSVVMSQAPSQQTHYPASQPLKVGPRVTAPLVILNNIILALSNVIFPLSNYQALVQFPSPKCSP